MEQATVSPQTVFSLRPEQAWLRGEGGVPERAGGGVCVSAARVLAVGARPVSPWGPPRGCKDDRRGGGGGRALS